MQNRAYHDMKGVKKQNLPENICQKCNLPFTWKKKWEKEWENVKFCSERCKKSKK
jgi:hypothetical protein